ncbi:MAG: JAB domain-containing protein, partial [Pseudanabaena sp.]
INLTRQLLEAARMLSIPLLDHLILGNGTFSSIREVSTLWKEVPQSE